MFSKPLETLANWITHHGQKRVYAFNEGSESDLPLLGKKGVCLSEMARLGLPVPAGFVITTEAALEYFDARKIFPESLKGEYMKGVHELERSSGRVFGGIDSFPLLVSVRAGAAVTPTREEPRSVVPTRHTHFSLPESWSLPGILGTVLNIGMNDEVCGSLAERAGTRFALDTYARHLMSFGTVVMGASPSEYYNLLAEVHPSDASGYTATDLQRVIEKFKRVRAVPTDPWEQLHTAITAVFDTWFSDDAIK